MEVSGACCLMSVYVSIVDSVSKCRYSIRSQNRESHYPKGLFESTFYESQWEVISLIQKDSPFIF